MHRTAISRYPWLTPLLILSALGACGCRSIAPPAPKYDVEVKPVKPAQPTAATNEQEGQQEPVAKPAPVATPEVVPSRKSLCDEPTLEMQAWDVEQGTDVEYTLCRSDRPVDDIEVGFRWRHEQVEIDILKNPEPLDPNHDELSIFLTNVHEAPLEIRVACDAVAKEAHKEVCKRYPAGQMVNFDIECAGRAEVGATGDNYELAITISPAEGQATIYKFRIGPLTGDCGS